MNATLTGYSYNQLIAPQTTIGDCLIFCEEQWDSLTIAAQEAMLSVELDRLTTLIECDPEFEPDWI